MKPTRILYKRDVPWLFLFGPSRKTRRGRARRRRLAAMYWNDVLLPNPAPYVLERVKRPTP